MIPYSQALLTIIRPQPPNQQPNRSLTTLQHQLQTYSQPVLAMINRN